MIDDFLCLYELDHHEPCLAITEGGTLIMAAPLLRDGVELRADDTMLSKMPKVFFADVPVIIMHARGIVIAPMSEANAATGPEL